MNLKKKIENLLVRNGFSKEFSDCFFPVLEAYYRIGGTEQFYWEQVLADILNGEARRRLSGHGFPSSGVQIPDAKEGEIDIFINQQPDSQVYEFENLEELRRFDPKYQNKSDNKAMELSGGKDAAITDSLGWLRYRQGRLEEAEKLVRKAQNAMPADTEIALHLAEILYVVGKTVEADSYIASVLEGEPNNTKAKELRHHRGPAK